MFLEPELPTGFPDLVLVRGGFRRQARRGKPLTAQHMRVLHHLFLTRGRSLESLHQDLLLPQARARQLLDRLRRAHLIRRHGDIFRPRRLDEIFKTRSIVAVEAKMANWKSALAQAIANLWFASHSYILIPANRNLRSVVQEARKHSIGVMVYAERRYRLAHWAPRQRIPSSYGSWLFNEWVLGQGRTNGRR